MFLFVIGVGGIIINVIFVSMKYFSYPISLSYTSDYEPFVWPEFTFCNPSSPFQINANTSQHEHWSRLMNLLEGLNESPLKKTNYFFVS